MTAQSAEATLDHALALARSALLAGDPARALDSLGSLPARAPLSYEARYWLASALSACGDAVLAAEILAQARTLHAVLAAREMGADLMRCRSDPAHACELASLLYTNDYPVLAAELWGMAISAGQTDPATLVSFGLAQLHQGRPMEAVVTFRAAGEILCTAAVQQLLLFPHIYLDDTGRQFSDHARRWAQSHAPRAQQREFTNRLRRNRRLRVGYVGPDFTKCQLRQFMAPVLEAHDPETVDVFLYPDFPETETDWPSWITIRPIGGLKDEPAAELIGQDGIDVLVDCWGHAVGSRLGVFALRAAPVQVGCINFTQTTGLPQMDYVIHADSGIERCDPSLYTESVWPIGPVFTTFRCLDPHRSERPAPALANGHATFGSFNHPAKLSDATVQAWSAILNQAPSSKLLLKYRYFTDPVLQRFTQARFAAFGVPPERLIFQGQSTGADYDAAFGQIDLALDPWPAPGSTTTLEALCRGVPVLVLGGQGVTTPRHYPRSMVEAAGLAELVASSPKDYVARAVALGNDIAALSALRTRVAPGFEAGPLRDEIGFTRRLEQTFGAMFDRWYATQARDDEAA